MAGNSVFSSQKRKFSYTTAGSESCASVKQPLKRKKSKENIVSGKPDDFDEWDDDLKLTQQELTDLDVAASQAYIQKTGTHHPTTSHAPTDLNAAPLKPALLHQIRGPQQNESNISVPKLVRHSSSTTSSSSTYPLSSSTYESFSSTSSSNGPKAGPLSHLTKTSSNTFAAPSAQKFAPGASTSTTLPNNLMTELENLREEMKKYEILKTEMYMKEGHIKFLQEDLQRREQEVSKLHQEKIHAETQERNEKEKNLKTEVERLSVELQFKNQEIYRLKEKCLEIKPCISSSSSSNNNATSSSGASSPKVRRLLVERPSSHLNTPQKIKEEKIDLMASPEKPKTNVKARMKRNCSLQVNMPKGSLHGSQLMSQLLQNVSTETNPSLALSNSGTNIVPLLHLHTTLDFQGVKFCRDANNFLLSPVAKSGADIQKIVETSDKKKSFVSHVNLNLALYGISQLLTTQGILVGRQLFDLTAESACKRPCPSLLLLPLLSEYFNQYSEQLSAQLLDSHSSPSSNATASSFSTAGSWKTSSVESSLESLSGSLNLLQQVRSDIANNLEHLTLEALKVLFQLGSFSPGLRWAILSLDNSNDSEKLVCSMICSLTMNSPERKHSGLKTGSLFSCRLSHLNIESLELLNKLFKLANPVPEMLYNPNIVQISLCLLILLAKSASPDQLERFEPVLSRGILCHSLNCVSSSTVQLRGLQLLQVLIGSPRILSNLCSDVELCPLAAMYNMVAKLMKDSTVQTQIYPTVIDILDTVNSGQWTSGMPALLNTNCPCAMDCVKCCVNMLYDLLEKHQLKCVKKEVKDSLDSNKDMESSSSSTNGSLSCKKMSCHCLNVLCKGILLLHGISQRDQHFEYRYQDVIHNYTILICRLQMILEQNEEQWKTEICALKELWEFVLDSDSSMEEDESQTETNMETN